MLDSDQEPSYNLSKNLLLLPRILKLIKDMVDDSTPLNYGMGVRYVFPGLIPYFCHDDLKHEIDNYLHKLSLSVQLREAAKKKKSSSLSGRATKALPPPPRA